MRQALCKTTDVHYKPMRLVEADREASQRDIAHEPDVGPRRATYCLHAKAQHYGMLQAEIKQMQREANATGVKALPSDGEAMSPDASRAHACGSRIAY